MFHENVSKLSAYTEAEISTKTYDRECQRDPGFLSQMERARNFPNRVAKQSLIRAMAKDGHLALRFLERTDPEFQLKSSHHFTDEDRSAQLKRVEEAGLSLPTCPELGYGFDPHGILERRWGKASATA